MSRAFVNEELTAAQADQPVERQISAQPNYVTPQGLSELQAKVAFLQTRHNQQSALGDQADPQQLADIERDLRYFNQRLQSAQVVPRRHRARKCRSAAGSSSPTSTVPSSVCNWWERIRPMSPRA